MEEQPYLKSPRITQIHKNIRRNIATFATIMIIAPPEEGSFRSIEFKVPAADHVVMTANN
jgi:hypothetical protein